MSQNLSRRKYAAITRFLNETMQDEGNSKRVRLSAAFRLCDVYTAHDARAWRLEDRAYRAALRAQGVSVTEPNETETAVPETAEQAAARFLQSVGRGVTSNE
jgi:hypothetical protein